jgi:hypothetical protein
VVNNLSAFDKAWQILKEMNEEPVEGEYQARNRIIDHEQTRGENQALDDVGEMPSVKELMEKIMRGEELTRHEQMMLQRFN